MYRGQDAVELGTSGSASRGGEYLNGLWRKPLVLRSECTRWDDRVPWGRTSCIAVSSALRMACVVIHERHTVRIKVEAVDGGLADGKKEGNPVDVLEEET